MSARLLFASLVAATALACGGSTSQDAGTGGSAGSTGGGGSSGAGGFGGSGAASGSGGGGTGGGQSCADFADEDPQLSVTVRFKNALSMPIYLGGGNSCGPEPLFDLTGPSGAVQMFPGGCGHTCEALQQHGDWCTDACMIPPVVMINPGGYWDESWSGTTYQNVSMPNACYFEPQYAPPSCDRRVVASPGSYAAVAEAGTSITCLDVGICGCDPGPQGACQIPYGAYLDGTPSLAAKASFELPSASLVVITFQ